MQSFTVHRHKGARLSDPLARDHRGEEGRGGPVGRRCRGVAPDQIRVPRVWALPARRAMAASR